MNTRRAVTTAAAAAVLALVPTAAVATTYGEPDGALAVSDATPELCEPFDVEVDGWDEVTEITLTITSDDAPDSAIAIAGAIAGVVVEGTSGTGSADDEGDRTFVVTLCEEGEYLLAAEDQDGTDIGSATVRVSAADGAVDVDDEQPVIGGDDDDDEQPAASGGTLPDTGSSVDLPLVAGAAAFLLTGAGLLFLARRRFAGQG
ncbi:LPXTG cell wall anchor domain-containing protein [Georgenia sp. 10Sc9-8]|uniref:LPXTG cell wall anchor domain-containing protein n=1 Tax=Georgenia halotolerans TaxID=3028317 RepID=A0ABT5TYF8_9MICO|nr:LPXTG cell wall anchor domain-containing protein [Georgenia halotolerans]